MAEKDKEVQSSQLNLAVVALVALVAIVGLVALVMNVAKIPTLATGGQLVQAQPTAPSQNVGGQASATVFNCYYAKGCTKVGNGYDCNATSVRVCDQSSHILTPTY